MNYCPNCAAPIVWQVVAGQERPSCAVCGFVHYDDPKLVAVAVIAIAGRLLLGRRAINPRLGFWSFPSGYVNRGETVEDAAVREVQEELCIEVRVERLIGLYSETDNPIVLAVFAAQHLSGEPRAGDEVSEVGLFAPTRLPDLAFPNDQRILRDWTAYSASQG